jgi:hypothetical protein
VSAKNKQEKFHLTFTFLWSRLGQLAPPPEHVEAGSIMEALLWFHLARQLTDGIPPEQYSIQQVTSNHDAPQRWDGTELPPSSPIRRSVLTKRMYSKFEDQIEALRAQGQHFEIA